MVDCFTRVRVRLPVGVVLKTQVHEHAKDLERRADTLVQRLGLAWGSTTREETVEASNGILLTLEVPEGKEADTGKALRALAATIEKRTIGGR